MGTGPDLVLLADGRIEGELAARWGTTVKALLPLDGRSMLDRTLDAYDDLRHLGRRVIVGPPELKAEAAARRVDTVVTARESALSNVLAALEWLEQAPVPGTEWVLLSATDLPFLTCEAVDEFLCRCPDSADLCLPIVERRPFERSFPGISRVFTRLRDGEWKVGGMVLVRAEVLIRNRVHLERIFDSRKRPMGIARLLGLQFLLSVLTRRATVPQVERQVSHILRCRAVSVVSSHPEIAFDVDHPQAFRGAAEWIQHAAMSGSAAAVRERRAA